MFGRYSEVECINDLFEISSRIAELKASRDKWKLLYEREKEFNDRLMKQLQPSNAVARF